MIHYNILQKDKLFSLSFFFYVNFAQIIIYTINYNEVSKSKKSIVAVS
jgi:hypothetical protein